MTVKEIAALENTTDQTVRTWIRLKKLKAKSTTTGYEISQKQYEEFVWGCSTGLIKRRDINA